MKKILLICSVLLVSVLSGWPAQVWSWNTTNIFKSPTFNPSLIATNIFTPSDNGTLGVGSGSVWTWDESYFGAEDLNHVFVPNYLGAMTRTLNNRWFYYTANGMATDTNIYFGPGSTNVLARSGKDLAYTNSNNDVKFTVINGLGNAASLESQGAAGVVSGSLGMILRTGADQAELFGGAFYPVVDLTEASGRMGNAWSDSIASNNIALGPHDNTTTNWARMLTHWSDADQAFSVDLQSLTNNVTGPGFGLKFKTNGVSVMTLSGVTGDTVLTLTDTPGNAIRLGFGVGSTGFIDGSAAGSGTFQVIGPGSAGLNIQANGMGPLVVNTDLSGPNKTDNFWFRDLGLDGSMYLRKFTDATGTNAVYLLGRNTGSEIEFDSRSYTNGVFGTTLPFVFKTNGVQVLKFYPTGVIEFGGTAGTNQLYPVGNDLYWNGSKLNP